MFRKRDPDKPSLNINGSLVYFEDVEAHTRYVIYERLRTESELRAFDMVAGMGVKRTAAKRRLELARQAAYADWLVEEAKRNGKTG